MGAEALSNWPAAGASPWSAPTLAPLPPQALRPVGGGTLIAMTAKEQVLEQAPSWTEAEARAALRVIEAHARLATYLDEEAQLSNDELDAREDAWAEENARQAIREERW